MSFSAMSITYDGVDYLSTYGLYHGNISPENDTSTSYKQNVTYEQNMSGELYVVNTSRSQTPQVIKIELISKSAISVANTDIIIRSLIKPTPRVLRYIQSDMTGVNLWGIFTNVSPYTIGNQVYGFVCEFSCDSQTAYSDYVTESLTGNGTATINYKCTDIEYGKVAILFTTNAQTVKIKNVSDDNRELIFTELAGSEVITITEDLFITSSTSLKRLGNCNKKFIRLVNGTNTIVCEGVSNISFTYRHKVYI